MMRGAFDDCLLIFFYKVFVAALLSGALRKRRPKEERMVSGGRGLLLLYYGEGGARIDDRVVRRLTRGEKIHHAMTDDIEFRIVFDDQVEDGICLASEKEMVK